LLSDGDISKSSIIEELDIVYVIDWLYLKKVKNLNELKNEITALERMKRGS